MLIDGNMEMDVCWLFGCLVVPNVIDELNFTDGNVNSGNRVRVMVTDNPLCSNACDSPMTNTPHQHHYRHSTHHM